MIELTGHKGLVVALAYAPDGRTLASASADGTARLWNLSTGKLTATMQSPAARACCVAFAPDGKSLAVGYGDPHGLVQLWDINPPRQRESWAAHPRTTRGVAFHPKRGYLATAGDPPERGLWGAVRLWDLEDGLIPIRPTNGPGLHLGGPPATAVAFSKDANQIAAVSTRPARVRVWQAADAGSYRSIKPASEEGHAIAFNADGDRLAVGLERTIALWNPADYRAPTIWRAHDGAVLGIAFTPDGQTLLTGGADGLVKLWSPDGRLRHTFDWKISDIGAVAFAPDGLTAAAGGAETILVWDVTE